METEIKVRLDDAGKARESLKSIGAIFSNKTGEIDEYFSLNSRDFWETLECLRIREMPEMGKAILTYKPPTTEKMKQMKMFFKEELETEIDPKVMRNILISLDCKSIISVEKNREYWKFEDKKVTIDSVKGLGDFMEVEMETDGKDVERARKDILGFLESIGIGKEKIVNEPYRCMLRNVK